ncbi:hypothetical protein [Nocardioides taihuensis]|jgi:hypothetical protein|uniref:DUF2158 domain-containing protein n=1 Tax=Nocardioides taihuensis TaxID=1835606 RepID=A0ABW0BM60_9ACTN
MSRTRGQGWSTGEPVTVYFTESDEREATWRAGSVLGWCRLDDEVWVTVQWYDLETLGFHADLVPAERCRKLTPSGLRRTTP